MNNYLKKILKCCAFAIATIAVGTSFRAQAFNPSTYAENSRLNSGTWVKISVPDNGLYAIPASTLRSWGFQNPEKVRVYGYGANRISTVLSEGNYIDDLPMAPSEYTPEQGLVFYGAGPVSWEESASRCYRQNFNIYTTEGFYFLSETDDDFSLAMTPHGTPGASSPATTFVDRAYHELELVAPGDGGYLLVGEDFRRQRNISFNIDVPDRVVGTQLWLETSAVAKLRNGTAKFTYSINNQQLPTLTSDAITPTSVTQNYHGIEALSRRTLNIEGDVLKFNVDLSSTVSVQGAWFNYASVNFTRHLRLGSKNNSLIFYSELAALELTATAGSKNVRVWDVTDLKKPLKINNSEVSASGTTSWTVPSRSMRTYAAWSEKSTFPVPTLVGKVNNQNLHANPSANMVIFALPELMQQGERIAQFHRSHPHFPLSVEVVNIDQVFNEFSSGAPDVAAMRKYLKMVYDRGFTQNESDLKYALILGRSTYDNRNISPELKTLTYRTVPQWMGGTTREQLNDNEAFGTDDVIAMLDDNSGSNLGLDNISIAVGRLPLRNATEAKSYVDKLIQYCTKSPKSAWKNQLLLVADDEDNAIHVEQMEDFCRNVANTPQQQHLFTKVYLDAFTMSNSVYPGARERMFHTLDEGAMWWNYVGHANNHGWTAEHQLTFTDITSMYLKHLPVLFSATCEFLRWDSPTTSGCEIMFHERYGGIIAAISATRPVYITDNGYFLNAIGRSLLKRDENGILPALGDIYRTAKNNILNRNGDRIYNPNRLRYVLMGDPAMRLVTPSNTVVLEAINGKPVGIDQPEQPILAAMQQADLSGYVVDTEGNIITDFNGILNATLYDAETSVTTNGRGDGKPYTFDEMGSKLFAGSAVVKDGRFTMRVNMPSTIADNFRPGTLNMHAYDTSSDLEAVGVSHDFYVYGYDENAPEDNEAPVIKSYFLNHNTFRSGDTVNESPLVIAEISDNIAINLSQIGVGQFITLTLDESQTYTDVSLFYAPALDGTPSGVINYPIENLNPGNHTLKLKVWDTSGNSTAQTIEFFVEKGLTPTIYDCYTDSSPASVEANFYLSHNRPNAMLTVEVSVYNLLGRPVWSSTTRGMSDMYLSTPVNWDLTDFSGRRVPRGIYLYRARISSDGETFDTISKKIAVTGK